MPIHEEDSIISKLVTSEVDSMVTGESVVFRPIGVVRTTNSDDDVRFRSKESESTIEVYPEFQEALEGLQGFSHIFVLSYLNKLRPDQMGVLKVKPRRLLAKGFKLEELPLVGVFAIDSPTRPNPIGLTLANLVKIDGGKVVVRGLDFFDGTPILDIKPYRGDYRADSYDLAHWYSELRSKAGEDV